MGTTKIAWTDKTWNCVTGCSPVSPGCTHCYAAGIAKRFWGTRPFSEVRCHPERLDAPLHWRKPCRVFVNSMSDLFHNDVPDTFIAQVFAIMHRCEGHTFQVLTKRPARMHALVSSDRFRIMVKDAEWEQAEDADAFYGSVWPCRNVWLGVTAENQETADERREPMNQLFRADWHTFVSSEPRLGPIAWRDWSFAEWMITGGESGAGARPMDLDWARSDRDWCANTGTAWFFKQTGGRASVHTLDGQEYHEFPEGA